MDYKMQLWMLLCLVECDDVNVRFNESIKFNLACTSKIIRGFVTPD